MTRTPFEIRHVHIAGKRTSIALEPMYWKVLEYIAKGQPKTWKDVTEWLLCEQPKTFKSRSAYLRLRISTVLWNKVAQLSEQLNNLKAAPCADLGSTSTSPAVTLISSENTAPDAPGSATSDPTTIDLPTQSHEAPSVDRAG